MNSPWLLQFVLNKVVKVVLSQLCPFLHRKSPKLDRALDFGRPLVVYLEFYTEVLQRFWISEYAPASLYPHSAIIEEAKS